MVIGVAVGQSPAQARAFRDRWGLTYPIWVDQKRRLYNRFAAMRLPLYNVLLDADRRVVTQGPEMYLNDITAHLARLTRAPRH